jgi:cell wall-associated NlpC family hydrolase
MIFMKISKKRILIQVVLIVAIFYSNIFAAKNNELLSYNNLLDSLVSSIRLKYAPDLRTSVFNIAYSIDNNRILFSGETNNSFAMSDLKQKLKDNKIVFVDSVKLLPDPQLNGKIYGIVNNSVSNHRSKPSYSAELATQALLGMPLNILKKHSYWYLVQTPDNYLGWVDGGAIQLVNKEEINDWLTCRKIVYWRQTGNSYEKPDENSQTVSDLVVCDVLKYVDTKGKFILAAYPDGRQAYVKKSECRDYAAWINSENPSAEQIINTAKKFMGLPYLWGGTSAKAVDCSGFTKMTFLVNGIVLQRDASQQALYGRETIAKKDFESLQPADLLFFGDKENEDSKQKVIHVALCLGKQKFIHASGNVSMNSFNKEDADFSSYRRNSFLIAKNYISNIGYEGIVKIKDCELYKIRK